MWNYVQMEDGFWYGMDATWDDQELSTGVREEYFLAGSNTIGFNPRYTFIDEHVPDMQITTGAPHPFVYPELEREKYEPGYRGSIREDENGKWLEIRLLLMESPLYDQTAWEQRIGSLRRHWMGKLSTVQSLC